MVYDMVSLIKDVNFEKKDFTFWIVNLNKQKEGGQRGRLDEVIKHNRIFRKIFQVEIKKQIVKLNISHQFYCLSLPQLSVLNNVISN